MCPVVCVQQVSNGSLEAPATKGDLPQIGAGEEEEIRGAETGTDGKTQRLREGGG